MPKRGDPRVSRRVVGFLRFHANMTQAKFGEESRTSQADVSRYELGEQVPSEETLRRMAKAAKLEWPVVVHLRRFIGTILEATDRYLSQSPDAGARLDHAVLEAARLAVAPYQVDSAGTARRSPPPEEARREAAEIVNALEAFSAQTRRRLVDLTCQASQSWALAERACEASVAAAAHDAADALAWAELALSVAEQVPGVEGFRRRLIGYCLAHVANALRVANDFDGADQAFTRVWSLWQTMSDTKEELLAEWRLFSLQASLRREQHRFQEALEWLDQALAAAGNNNEAAVRVLLKREQVLEQSGDHVGALAVLAGAAPLVESVQDSRLLLSHRFDTADNLSLLGHYTEAAAVLPEVRDLATQQANGLDLIRVHWLEGRVAAGLGKKAEAMAALDEVQREFTGRKLPYDAALASLELAVLWLEEGRTAEVRTLAVGMAWIFEAQGIQREALAALSLFQEAALREAASVDLVRRVLAEVEAMRRSAPRSG